MYYYSFITAYTARRGKHHTIEQVGISIPTSKTSSYENEISLPILFVVGFLLPDRW